MSAQLTAPALSPFSLRFKTDLGWMDLLSGWYWWW